MNLLTSLIAVLWIATSGLLAMPSAAQPYSATWTQMTPSSTPPGGPAPRGWVDTVYDSIARKHVLFGGSAGTGYKNDIWHYDLGTDSWQLIEPNVPDVQGVAPPCPRDEHSVEFDPLNRLYWSFGGTGFHCAVYRSTAASGTTTTTIFDPTLVGNSDDYYRGWRVAVPGPNVGFAWVISYDSASKRLTLDMPIAHLAPGSSYTILSQSTGGTWSYNPETRAWRALESPIWGYTGVTPITRFAPGFAAAPEENAILMFGGGESTPAYNDTWALDLVTQSWVPLIADGNPASPPRRIEITNSMAYDPDNGVVILFGGRCQHDSGRCVPGTVLNDTWAYRFTDNTWINMAPAVAPAARMQHHMVYDRINRVIVLYGGRSDSAVYDDVWVYSFTANTWTQVPTDSSTPGGRFLGAMAYDEALGRSILYGGNMPSATTTDGVWSLQIVNEDTTNLPPEVAITSPANGASFSAPASIPFSATASDPDGTVVKVEYFSGVAKIHESTIAPYAFTWTNVPPGNYSLTAKATDNRGRLTTSLPVSVSVTGTVLTYTLSGTITLDGAPLGGVTMSATGGVSCTPTDANGQYSCTVPQAYSGSVTPSRSGYSFTPASRSYSDVSANQSAQDYGATASADTIWVEDAIPTGGTSEGNEPWVWITSNPTPFSGTQAHRSALVSGMHQHFFNNASATLNVGAGETLFAYVYLDPANPPSQVMLQWNDGSWEHRAYWGANLINWGVNGTASRRHMGPLPPTGQWVRLEVPAALVGLEGRTLVGMAFTLHDGRAFWDAAGKR